MPGPGRVLTALTNSVSLLDREIQAATKTVQTGTNAQRKETAEKLKGLRATKKARVALLGGISRALSSGPAGILGAGIQQSLSTGASLQTGINFQTLSFLGLFNKGIGESITAANLAKARASALLAPLARAGASPSQETIDQITDFEFERAKREASTLNQISARTQELGVEGGADAIVEAIDKNSDRIMEAFEALAIGGPFAPVVLALRDRTK